MLRYTLLLVQYGVQQSTKLQSSKFKVQYTKYKVLETAIDKCNTDFIQLCMFQYTEVFSEESDFFGTH